MLISRWFISKGFSLKVFIQWIWWIWMIFYYAAYTFVFLCILTYTSLLVYSWVYFIYNLNHYYYRLILPYALEKKVNQKILSEEEILFVGLLYHFARVRLGLVLLTMLIFLMRLFLTRIMTICEAKHDAKFICYFLINKFSVVNWYIYCCAMFFSLYAFIKSLSIGGIMCLDDWICVIL